MRLLKLTQKYAAAAIFVVAIAGLAGLAGAGGGPLINQAVGEFVSVLEMILMANVPLLQMPLVVAVLFLGAVYFTFRFRFINFRAFGHAIDVLRGAYDNPDDPGDVSHFQALSSALSATVGLGNIAGVAIAVSLGGPGAVFWMMVVALFGMNSKFAEATLGQMYRQTDTEGAIRGGPMVYLREGLKDRTLLGMDLTRTGIFLSVLFSLLCIGASLGAGNMFQANQSFAALSERVQWLGGSPSKGEVTLRADEPIEFDKASHLVRFVAPPRSDAAGQEPTGFLPPEDLPIKRADWSGDPATLDLTFRSADSEYHGRVTLRVDEPIKASSLSELIAQIKAPGGEEFSDPDALELSADEWRRTEAGAALEMEFKSGDGSTQGTVEVRSTTPNGADGLGSLLTEVAKPVFNLSGANLLGFQPRDSLKIAADDWTTNVNGNYETTIPIQAEKNGTAYDVRADQISNLMIAKLGPEKRTIEKWEWIPQIHTSNTTATSGGINPRGWAFGLLLAFLVGLVIVGGIKSIARVAEKIVPAMCALYIAAGLIVIGMNIEQLGWAVSVIMEKAFTVEAGWGIPIAVFVQGVRRAAFSSEAGIGSAPIAHSAAQTDEPVREGVVAMLGPFIDTIVVCFITGMVIVISGVWAEPSTAGLEGVTLTAAAFGTELAWFPWVLSIAVVLFAFSTMISWSYYGERCWTYLFGDEQAMAFRLIFVFFIVLGAVSSLGNVLGFGDYLLLAMAFPNIVGVVILSDEIDERLREYWRAFQNDEFERFDE
jgi:Na+/alanine symporter